MSASAIHSTPISHRHAATSWSRLLKPSFSDFLFMAIIVWLFMLGEDGWSRLLLDGDTGWHIRTGEHILSGRGIPFTDLFSFSRAGEPWFAWEWGADVISALFHQAWGLKGIVLLGAAQVALFAVILFRYMIWRGSNTLIALAVGLLAMGGGSVHYLARPHLYTLILLPAAIWMIERDRLRPNAWTWLLVPISALWTNLHGGFMALLACLGLLVLGTAIETLWHGETGGWPAVRRYGMLTGLCSLATLVNPYGWRLHQHVLAYLRSDWIREAVEEFQSPRFRSENLLHFEILLLAGLVACAGVLSRRGVTEVLWILFWAHQSLASVRHVTVYVTLAAPIIALEASILWRRWAGDAPRKSTRRILDSLALDMHSGFRWTSLWPLVFLGVLAFGETGVRWPADFPRLRFPVDLVSRHADLLKSSRVITTDQWADYLVYRFHPVVKVFFDGRSDFYGPKLGQEYVRMSGGGWDWRLLMERHDFDTALVPVDWALASLLKQDPTWRLLTDDGKCLLFHKAGRVGGKNPRTGLMKSIPPSETSMRELIDMKTGIVAGHPVVPPVPGSMSLGSME